MRRRHPSQPPAATAVPYTGPAVLGAPLSAFVKAYGAYSVSGSGAYQFPTDANQSAILFVTIAHGQATEIVLSADTATWDDTQTIAACAPFLPVGASRFNADGPYIDYHSTLGEIIMQHAPGSCQLTISA
jgi:hypothetical protein